MKTYRRELRSNLLARVPPFVKRACECFVTVGSHWIMHTGQCVVLRRKFQAQGVLAATQFGC